MVKCEKGDPVRPAFSPEWMGSMRKGRIEENEKFK